MSECESKENWYLTPRTSNLSSLKILSDVLNLHGVEIQEHFIHFF